LGSSFTSEGKSKRPWGEAGPVLVWITMALTIYSGLGFTWHNRELIAPDQ
jgi:hypothetical protein